MDMFVVLLSCRKPGKPKVFSVQDQESRTISESLTPEKELQLLKVLMKTVEIVGIEEQRVHRGKTRTTVFP